MNLLIEKARNYSNETIIETLKQIGGGQVEECYRMVRAALVEVYAERNGEHAADSLMTDLGM